MLPNQVHTILAALLEDVARNCELSVSLDEDLSRILKASSSRGPSLIMEGFPALCRQLETSLDNGYIVPVDGLPFTSKGIPTLFGELYNKIFDAQLGLLLVDPCIGAIRALRQIYTCFKGLNVPYPDEYEKAKIHEFLVIEQGLISPHLSWGATLLHPEGHRYPYLLDVGLRVVDSAAGFLPGYYQDAWWRDLAPLLHRIQEISDRVLSNFVYRDEWFRPKHGPGAVSEPYESSKYEFPTWPERLERMFPYDLHGLFNQADYDLSKDLPSGDSPAKLIAVPKDYRGPRLIASEPICAQYIQQGLLSVLRRNIEKSVLKHCIDFTSQTPSRVACQEASRTGGSSTIDLSSASDRLSCAVVEAVFRRSSLLSYLNSARTPCLLVNDERIELKKFAAQGAAFTFPVQSIVYALVCMGVISYETQCTNLTELAKQVRVFGDDMIVPTPHFRSICDVLTCLQLKVNREKSFAKGKFRESCGMDAFAGEDVTPAKVNRIFEENDKESLVSAVECSNNLYERGYICASRALLETIPERLLKDIPWTSRQSTVMGFRSPGEHKLRRRWNKYLHRYETRILAVEGKVLKSNPDGHLLLFQRAVERPAPDLVWRGGEVERVKHRYVLTWVPDSEIRCTVV